MDEHNNLILDGTKFSWHLDRVEQWQKGERIAPITIDMALTRACNYSCGFCYAMFQENDRKVITKKVIFEFLEDCAEIGVKGISFVSDGESTISPVFADACKYGHELGLSMAVGTNAFVLTKNKLEDVMPYLIRRAEENTSVAGQTSRELSLLKKEKNRRKVTVT